MLDHQGFDLWADGYDQSVGLSDEAQTYPFAGYKKLLNAVYNRVLKASSKHVLNIGFGSGTLTARLYERGCEIYGQDFSEKNDCSGSEENAPVASVSRRFFKRPGCAFNAPTIRCYHRHLFPASFDPFGQSDFFAQPTNATHPRRMSLHLGCRL